MRKKTYRERLASARKRLRLTPEAMANLLMTPAETYLEWERGNVATPGVAVVAAEHVMSPDPGSFKWVVMRLANGEHTMREVADRAGLTTRQVKDAVKHLRDGGKYPSFRPDKQGRRFTYGDDIVEHVVAKMALGQSARSATMDHMGRYVSAVAVRAVEIAEQRGIPIGKGRPRG